MTKNKEVVNNETKGDNVLSKSELRLQRLKTKPQMVWKSHRPKVELDNLFYEDPYTRDYISTYIDFHGRNKHCVSPRPSKDIKELGPKIRVDEYQEPIPEDAPYKAMYFGDQIRPEPKTDMLPFFQINTMGGFECDTSSVTKAVSVFENEQKMNKLDAAKFMVFEDPWYNKSIRDELEDGSHVDGYHTVKSKTIKPRHQVTTKDPIYRVQPISFTAALDESKENFNNFNKLFLQQTAADGLEIKKVVKGPFDNTRIYSKYTNKGTALNEWKAEELKFNLKNAHSHYKKSLLPEIVSPSKKKKKKNKDNKLLQENSILTNEFTDTKTVTFEDSVMGNQSTIAYTIEDDNSSFKTAYIESESLDDVRDEGSMELDGDSWTKEDSGTVENEIQSSILDLKEKKKTKKKKKDKISIPLLDLTLEENVEIINNSLVPPEEAETPPTDQEIVQKLGGIDKVISMADGFISYAEKIRKKASKGKTFNLRSGPMDFVDACNRGNIMKMIMMLASGVGDANMEYDEKPIYYNIFLKLLKLDTELFFFTEECQPTSEMKDYQKVLNILFKYGANKDGFTEGFTILQLAAKAGCARLVAWLLSEGCNPNNFSIVDRFSPMMLAARGGCIDTITVLVKHGVDVNAQNTRDQTALHACALTGQTNTALFLIRLGASKIIKDKWKQTAAAQADAMNYMIFSQEIKAICSNPPTIVEQLQYEIDQRKKVKTGLFGNMSTMLGQGADKKNNLFLSKLNKKDDDEDEDEDRGFIGKIFFGMIKGIKNVFSRNSKIDIIEE